MLISNQYSVYSQQDEALVIEEEGELVEAANRYKPRPKFLVFETEFINNFTVTSNSDEIGNAEANVSQNLIREGKIKFPIILKERTNIIGGFGYRHEQFKFNNLTDANYPLFERFDDKSLKRVTFSSYLKHDFNEKKFLFMYFNSSLNSDKPRFRYFLPQLKISLATLKGKRIGLHKEIGYGISFGYDFGQPAVFPLFMLNNDFSLHWGYELLLPKSAKLRYSPNVSNHFISTLELQGASYYLRDSVLESYNELEFRRSSVRFTLTYEREIHDWLWFGLTAGYRIPINIFLSEPGDRRADAVITIEARTAPYINFAIFLVPPNKLYNRAKGSG
ncbi:hypothetical protein [Fulvivirga lutea]|uniref:Uncharacterized protein n=1 Tax=Fulvivirga lutea TaxID=2810512 RepID=A0A974WL75_9BACT|nr:hypothetical protein [Fulvivirga lutea]QSE99262.1 hypothetical protein JR347_09285 [Fulvivirga lutea]